MFKACKSRIPRSDRATGDDSMSNIKRSEPSKSSLHILLIQGDDNVHFFVLKDRQGVSARVWGWLRTSIGPNVSCTLMISCNMTWKL